MADSENNENNNDAPVAALPVADRPGFISPRGKAANDPEFEEAQEAERRAAASERAAFKRAADKRDQDEELAHISGEKAGFKNPANPAANPAIPPSENGTSGGGDFDLKGKGWIYCGKDARGRGTWLKDCGDSLEVPFSKIYGMSEGQKRKIMELSQEKGWTKLYAFKGDGRHLHELATQQLHAAGLPCCTDPKHTETLKQLKTMCREHHKHHCEDASHQPQAPQTA